jgi:hypothetical protein
MSTALAHSESGNSPPKKRAVDALLRQKESLDRVMLGVLSGDISESQGRPSPPHVLARFGAFW